MESVISIVTKIVMDKIISIVTKIVEWTMEPVVRHLLYPIHYKKNIDNLRTQATKLDNIKVRLQRSVDEAIRKGEEIEDDVQSWLKSVDKIIGEAENSVEDESKEKISCFIWFCLIYRYKLSKEVKEKARAIIELQGEGNFSKVSYRKALRWIETATFTKDFKALESRMTTLKEIMEALIDSYIDTVGVYGLGGVGKTTLAKEVRRQANENKLFDVVVMIVVTQNPDVEKIQGEIADMLGLKFDEETTTGRASRLYERLKKEKKILLIFDDLWIKLDLEAVGVPSADVHKGCKMLLISRNQDVLSREMGTQRDFRIQELVEKEAWSLFENMAGDDVKDPNFQSIAFEIAKNCAGLPVLIVTVAKALNKKKSLSAWKDALKQLQGSSNKGISAKVHASLELSYNYLEGDEVKSLFLLCGLMGLYHIPVEYLVRYSMGLGLFEDINWVEEARNRVDALLHDLKASCLVLDDDTDKFVKMHAIVRDVAISIARRDRHMLTIRNRLKEWPKKEILKKCPAISLPYADVQELPEGLKYPALQTFLLYTNDDNLRFPDSFFQWMRELRVLDLTGMYLLSQPLSLQFLTNLRTLCLDHCTLCEIPFIGALKKLEILSLVKSDIRELPKEIGQLTDLRLLDLNNCSKLEVIPPNVISCLTKLEDLHMENSFVQWEVEGQNNENKNASLSELKHLHHLTTLDIHIRDAEILPKDLFSDEKLERFKIFIGDIWDWSGKYETSRTLKLKLNTSFNSKEGLVKLLKRTADLYLDELTGVKSLLYDLDKEGFAQLKHLHVQNNAEIKYIVNTFSCPKWVQFIAFPILESLFLKDMINLEDVYHGQLRAKSFCKLRTVKVECCDRLKFVFSSSIARGLLQLQDVEINECCIMGAILHESGREDEIEVSDGMTDIIEFPQLCSLTLQNLPMLTGFCSEMNECRCLSLRTQNPEPLQIDDMESKEIISGGKFCPHSLFNVKVDFQNLEPLQIDEVESKEIISNGKFYSHSLFNEKVKFPNLETLRLSSINLEKIWHDQLSASSCTNNLTSLNVEGCGRLKCLLSSSMARSLVQLKLLKISNCHMMEEIIIMEERMDNPAITATQPFLNNEKVTLPNLETIVISQMDNLKHIWNKDDDPQAILSFQNLHQVDASYCQSLKYLFPASVAKGLLQLEELNIKDCYKMEEIVAKEEAVVEPAFLFPRVTTLNLFNLSNLRSFYPGLHTLEMPSLIKLDVFNCDKVEVFTSTSFQKTHQEAQLQPMFSFEKVIPKLEELSLNSKDTVMIWQGEFPVDLFQDLKVLRLQYFEDELATFPCEFLQRVSNLENLVLERSYFKELFPCESLTDEEIQAGKMAQLKGLRLVDLPKLEHICREDSQLHPALQILETLDVLKCPSLTKLVPSSISFECLTILKVWKCDKMVNLVSSSTAKSLVRLTRMTIEECSMIEEIVESKEDEVEDVEIVFSQLKSLKLLCLPSLTSYSSSPHSFKFPSLEKVIVRECPKMIIFSKGVLSTPKLQKVRQDEGGWKGDLNTTIQHFCGQGRIQIIHTPTAKRSLVYV